MPEDADVWLATMERYSSSVSRDSAGKWHVYENGEEVTGEDAERVFGGLVFAIGPGIFAKAFEINDDA